MVDILKELYYSSFIYVIILEYWITIIDERL